MDLLTHVLESAKTILTGESTHCIEVLSKATKPFQMRRDVHATVDGIRAIITYEDGWDYEIYVRPIRRSK